MGNAPGQLSVTVEGNGKVRAGQIMNGRCDLHLLKDVDAQELRMRFHGYEATHITRQESSGVGKNKHTKTVHYYGNHDIFNHDCILHNFMGGVVKKGDYSFPFSIPLPQGLPPSIYALGGDVKVNYLFEARLNRHGMLKWDVQSAPYFINGTAR